MTPEEFKRLYPIVNAWIEDTLRSHASITRSVASAGFKRLPRYYSPGLLARAKYVPVPRAPKLPLAEMGLSQFAEFEKMEPDGITYLDTYFVRLEKAASEQLHFHELIHVVQWLTLGSELFMVVYADGLEKFSYRDSPLEVMAYDAEAVFARGGQPFDAEQLVREKLAKLVG